jgi:hypothetical protein
MPRRPEITRALAVVLASVAFVPAVTVAGCASRRVVPLLASAGIPITSSHAGIPLEVVTRSTAVRDPLPVAGSPVVYGDFEAALGHAVSSAAVPWVAKNQHRRPGGWQLFVEVIQAEAEHDGARLVVAMSVRATLRARVGGAHLAQTEATCKDAGLVGPERGAPVLYACMTRIGRDLTGWLAAADPETRPKQAGPARTLPAGGVVGSSGAYEDSDDDGDSDSPGEDD